MSDDLSLHFESKQAKFFGFFVLVFILGKVGILLFLFILAQEIKVSARFLGYLLRKQSFVLFHQLLTEGMDGLLPDFSLGNGQFSDTLSPLTHNNFTRGFLCDQPWRHRGE